MPDVSNPTRRVLDVLNFLAAHPTETFTLAEIARHLGQSTASAYRVLTTMSDAQFLSRNEQHKTYSLGMAPIAIGQAAIERHRGIEIARRELTQLSVELRVQCAATALVGDDHLILVKEGTPQSHEGLSRVGERRPVIPPLGICHVAWAGEQAIQSYLAKASAHMSKNMRAHLLAAFPLIRRRGYAMTANGPGMRKLRQATFLPIDQIRGEAYWASIFELVGRLSAKELQLADAGEAGADGISYIAAPVFSPAGTVSLQVLISGMPTNLSVKTVRHYAERLCAAAAIITSETHGKRPKD
jgi:DNA-binding IclR family transcriptional regulator